MDTSDFQRLLLSCAIHAMACDGEVHEDEVAAIQRLVDGTPYFTDVEVDEVTSGVVSDLQARGAAAIESGIADLQTADLLPKQRLRVVDVLLQVVAADGEVIDAEKNHVRRVVGALDLSTTDLVTTYPTHLDILMGRSTGEFGTNQVAVQQQAISGLDGLSFE